MSSKAVACLLSWAGLLVGCGGLGHEEAGVSSGEDPFKSRDSFGGIPSSLRPGSGSQQVKTHMAVAGQDPAAMANQAGDGATLLTPESDIVWTDPDNPDAELEGLEDMIKASKDQKTWEDSYTDAKKRALREGKPLLVWFTDSRRSPVCQTLTKELFGVSGFDSWAMDNVVRLKLDFNVRRETGTEEDQMDREARKLDYLKRLEERLNARGKPHVLVMSPDGNTIGRYRGYKPGTQDFFWGQLKHTTIIAQKHHDEWVEKMEKKGYRNWESRDHDFQTFAKLLRYRNGEMILVEPGGNRFKTEEVNLSQRDRLWIAGEKAKRQ